MLKYSPWVLSPFYWFERQYFSSFYLLNNLHQLFLTLYFSDKNLFLISESSPSFSILKTLLIFILFFEQIKIISFLFFFFVLGRFFDNASTQLNLNALVSFLKELCKASQSQLFSRANPCTPKRGLLTWSKLKVRLLTLNSSHKFCGREF